jgi:hypothetical protein
MRAVSDYMVEVKLISAREFDDDIQATLGWLTAEEPSR